MPTNTSPTGPLTELGRYATLCGELSHRVEDLGSMHAQRAEVTGQLEALKITRDRLNESILDCEGPAQTLAENLQGLETERLVLQASLDALAPRLSKAETELHARLPLAILCFARLHGRLVTCIADTAKESVKALLAPGYSVAEEHLDAIVIATPAFVEISQLKLPGLTHILTRDLEFTQPHWSSLVRPFTPQEKAALRLETVKALVDASNELVLAARRLIELIKGYPDRVPEFKCEPEAVAPPQSVAPLEWLQPLGGSDEEWLREICQQAGKPYPPTDPAQIEILNKMLEQRHAHPISHGVVTAEMVGSTTQT